MNSEEIVQRLWNLCDVLRDDGVSYSDYVTELVWLLFMKMEQENTAAGIRTKHALPAGCRWSDLSADTAGGLVKNYQKILTNLGKVNDPLLRAIYRDARTHIKHDNHLLQLIKEFNSTAWFSDNTDGLGDIYEGLLEKNANDTKSGAGQYFTPRPLIDSIIRVVKPQPGETIQDPAAGTGGFLIAADRYIRAKTANLTLLSPAQRAFQRKRALVGMELVPNTRRLALMNCVLHDIDGDEGGVIMLGNALGVEGEGLPNADLMLSNPPFGTAKGGGGPTRTDLPFKTPNKQLAFLQHIYLKLKPDGRAAVIVPDNVLFESGIGKEIRRDLMQKCNLHTILRLPPGIFYAPGVKTNVLFFSKRTAKPANANKNKTHGVWIYDMRSNMPSFGKRTRFQDEILRDFETAFGDDPYGGSKREDGGPKGRFRLFSREFIANEKDDSLDITWLKDESQVDAHGLEPHVLAARAMGEIAEALRELNQIMHKLGAGEEASVQLDLLADALRLPMPEANDRK
ncbi:N-6 DNA methylase [Burkholderia multivorans]|uniref:class I SAM-dependent DNA methyltransferase n=1 Tax=Burkholderia multivorans TaxID=87883 RepID=UPI0009BCA39F|nr:N-6 DNA methylase [Burkholderia multivorans]